MKILIPRLLRSSSTPFHYGAAQFAPAITNRKLPYKGQRLPLYYFRSMNFFPALRCFTNATNDYFTIAKSSLLAAELRSKSRAFEQTTRVEEHLALEEKVRVGLVCKIAL